jgi:3'-phosphoadenosine 5'-phosphosulfate sulfotransferase (PAPS reductase)/FAD synthetase
MKNIFVAVSGGRSSAMMAYHIHTNEKYKDYHKAYVFANTGMEKPETIEFLKKINSVWGIPITIIEGTYSNVMGVAVGFKIVDWESLSMDAKPFEECIMHTNKGEFSGLPNQEAPYCSSRMKTIPCEKFANEIFGKKNYIKAIGFRREDMPKRISWAEINNDEQRVFPLLTDFSEPIGLSELNSWWNKQAFKLGINSKLGNCELCWKKSDNNLVEVIRNGTRFIDWWRKMEKQYGNTSFRNRKSIFDLVEMANKPFTMNINFLDSNDECVCQI